MNADDATNATPSVQDLSIVAQIEAQSEVVPKGKEITRARVGHLFASKLYGRTKEIRTLCDHFERHRREKDVGMSEFLLLTGLPGAGKSVLAGQLEQLTRHHQGPKAGIFAKGKFDYQQRDTPLYGILNALQDLMNRLGTLKYQDLDRFHEDVQLKVLEDLGMETVHFLGATLLPGIERLLQRAPKEDESSEFFGGGSSHLGLVDIPPTESLKAPAAEATSSQASRSHSSIEKLSESELLTSSPRRRVTFTMGRSQAQVQDSLKKFLRSISKIFGPCVMVLDDLQLADLRSIQLLEAVLGGECGWMIVGTCRSTELDHEKHELLPMMQRLSRLKFDMGEDNPARAEPTPTAYITTIALEDLSQLDIEEMLIDLFDQKTGNDEDVQKFAEIILKKTRGSPFFVQQFLLQLVELEILQCEENMWAWDLDSIQTHMPVTMNVVNFLQQMIANDSSPSTQWLPLVACLGSTFDPALLHLLVNHSNLSTQSNIFSNPSLLQDLVWVEENDSQRLVDAAFLLKNLTELGYLEYNEKHETYSWAHDTVLEAATSLVDKGALQPLFVAVGYFLLEHMTRKQMETNVFLIVELLSSAENHGAKPQMAAQVLKLYRFAGDKAMLASSFDLALVCFQKSLEVANLPLLPKEEWVHLLSITAQACYCVGNFEEATRYCQIIIDRPDLALLEKRKAYDTQVAILLGSNRTDACKDLCVQLLAKLDIHFPKRFHIFHVFGMLLKGKKLAPTLLDRLPELPWVEDPEQEWAFALIDHLSTCGYMLEGTAWLPFSALKGFFLMSKYGVIGETTPSLLVVMGLLVYAALKDLDLAIRLARAGTAIAEDPRCKDTNGRAIHLANYFVFPWKDRLEDCMPHTLLAYESAKAAGDTESAAFAIAFYFHSFVRVGGSIRVILVEVENFTDEVKRWSQDFHYYMFLTHWQVAMNLSGKNTKTNYESHLLLGDIIAKDSLEDGPLREHPPLRAVCLTQEIFLAFSFEKWDVGFKILTSNGFHRGFMERVAPCSIDAVFTYFYCASICTSMAQKKGRVFHRRRYIRLAKYFNKRMKTWLENGSNNVDHFLALIRADLSAMEGKHEEAKAAFGEAIRLTRERNLRNLEAFANEQNAEYLWRNQERFNAVETREAAQRRALRAIKLYEEWGAHAKTQQVMTKFAPLFNADMKNPSTLIVSTGGSLGEPSVASNSLHL